MKIMYEFKQLCSPLVLRRELVDVTLFRGNPVVAATVCGSLEENGWLVGALKNTVVLSCLNQPVVVTSVDPGGGVVGKWVVVVCAVRNRRGGIYIRPANKEEIHRKSVWKTKLTFEEMQITHLFFSIRYRKPDNLQNTERGNDMLLPFLFFGWSSFAGCCFGQCHGATHEKKPSSAFPVLWRHDYPYSLFLKYY